VARRRRNRAAFAALLAALWPAEALAGAAPVSPVSRVCDLIAVSADRHRLPRAYLARLIWKESRFDPNAVSPKGAEGIAQFMPGTAEMRGLADAFDIEQAIPASAAYLAELEQRFGNLGLAAAAYNAGEGRVGRWLSSGGFLPMETENYVLDITGAPADAFADGQARMETPPLDPERSFAAACRRLPVARSQTVAMATVPVKPWGVQVAGSFNRTAAIRQWERFRVRHAALLDGEEAVISRVRSARGRSGIHAVRLGAETRQEAESLCAGLRRAGAPCVVLANR
jgi:hypothetical protein